MSNSLCIGLPMHARIWFARTEIVKACESAEQATVANKDPEKNFGSLSQSRPAVVEDMARTLFALL